jgi:hypothetical protein
MTRTNPTAPGTRQDGEGSLRRPSPLSKKRRPSTYKKRPANLDRYTCDMALNIVARKIEVEKANNGGVLKYKAMTDIVNSMKPTLPWLTKDMLRNHIKKLNKEKMKREAARPPDDVDAAASPANDGGGQSTSTLSALTLDTGGNSDTMPGITSSGSEDNLGGRPKGSSAESKRDLKERKRLATLAATKQYQEELKKKRKQDGSTARLMHGTLATIIEKAKAFYNVENSTINPSTIRSRCKRNHIDPVVLQGTTSPMAAVEPYLIAVILQLAQMRCPINATMGLHLANSMIEGTVIAKAIMEKREKHRKKQKSITMQESSSSLSSSTLSGTASTFHTASCKRQPGEEQPATAEDVETKMLLGTGYWNRFMKRHQHIIRSKRSVKFEAKRAEWCTYENFSEMYAHIYEAMVEHGIASKCDTNVKLDRQGEIVEHVEEAFGLPTQYLIQRPDKLLFVDEVGSNTCTTKDGHVGGEKFLCQADSRPQIKAATKDSHFTVLGFTAATGEPVMCAIIFSAKEMCTSWVLGLNASAPWVGDKNDRRANTGGINKQHPQGPVCHFNGKTVPTFCCCSESGSITSELLVEMLRAIDKIGVFDRSDGIHPFLILDGHGSRFELPFLRYVNDKDGIGTKWNACVGVPYGTSYWQVGDSSEQNGCFKMALTRYKRELLRRKELAGIEFGINKEDITYIVNQAWADSFARVVHNKSAIADRGWNPLNYNCLLHPEIAATRYAGPAPGAGLVSGGGGSDGDDDGREDVMIPAEGLHVVELLNLSKGLAGSLIDEILETRARDDARNGVNLEENRRKRVETAKQIISEKKKKYSSGLHVAAQRWMTGPDVLDNLEEREQQQAAVLSHRQEKKLREFRCLKSKVDTLKAQNKIPAEMSVSELKLMVTWYKNAGDLPVPTTKAALLERLHATIGRDDPTEPAIPTLHYMPQPPAVADPLVHMELEEDVQ